MVSFSKLAAAATAVICVAAHPGEQHDHEHVKREVQERDLLAARAAESLSKCAGSVNARALKERAIARRAATAEKLRKKRGIERKDFLHRRDLEALENYETVNHNMTGSIESTDDLFAANTSCVLTPEDVVGPYYVSGELIRSDVTEGESGVPMHLEMQFIDIDTCEPVSDLLIDIWAANATGVYSGVDSTGEGGLNTTFLRGLQQSDSDGVVEFDTLFPGHYEGRATHNHLMAHAGATAQSNGSYSGGTIQHIGQIFFPERLRSAVEAISPYNTNTAEVTTNDEDMWAPSQASDEYDPFPQYIYVGDKIEDGLLLWISIGLNISANYDSDASAAAYYAADGGHSTGSTMGGGAGPSGNMTGGPGGNGTMPGNGTFAGNSTFAVNGTSTTASSGAEASSTTLQTVSVAAAQRLRALWRY